VKLRGGARVFVRRTPPSILDEAGKPVGVAGVQAERAASRK
jgi:hypothetical protein